MATTEQINETISRYLAAFNANDGDAYVALFTDEATVEDPVGSEVRRGPADIAAFWTDVHALATSIELRANGPECAAPPEAAFPIQIITDLGGTKMVLDATDVMAFAEDGRITAMRAYWDLAAMRVLEED